MSETTQAPFTLRDGLNLGVYDWPLAMRQRPRAVVLLVHGLGEHAWRYDDLAMRLNEWGFCVRAYDQRGHGESGGPRGVLPDDDTLLDDLDEVLDDTRRHIAHPWSCPLILLGHSMGGLVSAAGVLRAQSRHQHHVDALILSSPALASGLGAFRRALVALLMRLAPDLAVPNGLKVNKLSHDSAVVAAYRQDRLVHNRISARLARFILLNGPRVLDAAPRWRVPTLLLYAGADHLVDPAGSRAFGERAPRQIVDARCFEALYHELFNEENASQVFDTLRAWLDVHAAPR